MRMLHRIASYILTLSLLASIGLFASPVQAGVSVNITPTSISDAPKGNGGYDSFEQSWTNQSLLPVTLKFSDGSSLSFLPNESKQKTFTSTTTYYIDGNDSVTSKITIYEPLSKGLVTATSVTLSWGTDTGTNSISTTNYSLYRNNQLLSTVSGTSHTDTSVTPGTSYTYRVASNRSDGSHSNTSELTVKTPQDEVPSAPTNLKASVTGSSGELTWTASTDDNEVSSYVVYLDGKQLGLAYSNKYSLSNLKAGTSYSYTVKARDDAGQLSATSNTATVKIEASSTPSASPSASTSPTPSASPTPVTEPVLQKIIIDDKEYNPSATFSPTIEKGKVIHLTGLAPANAALTVGIYSSKTTYPAIADKNGTWSADIPTTDLDLGNHRITLASNQAGQAGTESDVAQFTLVEPGSSSATPEATGKGSRTSDLLKQLSLIIIILAALGVLISGGVLLRNYLKDRKQKKVGRLQPVPASIDPPLPPEETLPKV